MSRYVEVRFDGTNWTDITDTVETINIRRGRSGDLALVEAGTCGLVLWNDDGEYTPENTQGTYSPNVLPGVKVRVSQDAGDTGTTVDDATVTVDDATVGVDGDGVKRLFTGHAVRWEPVWESSGRAAVLLDCVDGFEQLTNYELRAPYAETVIDSSPDGYWMLGDGGGDFSDSSGNGQELVASYGSLSRGEGAHVKLGTGSVGIPTTSEDPAIASRTALASNGMIGAVNDITVSAWVSFAEGAAGTGSFVVVRTRTGHYPWVFGIDSSGRMTFDTTFSSGSDSAVSSPMTWADDETYQIGFWFDQSAGTVTFYRNGSSVSSASITAPSGTENPAVDIGVSGLAETGFLSELALWSSDQSALMADLYDSGEGFPSDLPGVRIGRLLDWAGWDATARDIDTGTTPLAAVTSGTALSACQDAGAADGGVFYMAADGTATFQGRRTRWETDTTVVATFDDDGTDTSYEQVGWRFDTTYLANRVVVDSNTQGTSDGVAEDVTSQTSYGKRTLTISTVSNNTADNAERAQWELSRRKDPHLRLESIGLAVGSDGEQDVAATLELQDLVEVNRRPGTGQDDLTVTLRVASIDHTFSNGGWLWDFTVGLLEADTDQPGAYGTAVYDTDYYGY